MAIKIQVMVLWIVISCRTPHYCMASQPRTSQSETSFFFSSSSGHRVRSINYFLPHNCVCLVVRLQSEKIVKWRAY
jgi:hypothetical protein